VNSNSQLTTKEWAVLFRLAESTRAHWVLPGLVRQETGWGEINGTKYIKAATGFPEDRSCPTSNRMVGPVAASGSGTTAGGPAWPSDDSRPFAQSATASSTALAPRHSGIGLRLQCPLDASAGERNIMGNNL
jgi:hypothetical protein